MLTIANAIRAPAIADFEHERHGAAVRDLRFAGTDVQCIAQGPAVAHEDVQVAWRERLESAADQQAKVMAVRALDAGFEHATDDVEGNTRVRVGKRVGCRPGGGGFP